jgi:hypothetical protein
MEMLKKSLRFPLSMERILHYTTEENLRKIEAEGALLPKSSAFDFLAFGFLDVSERVIKLCESGEYLVGFPVTHEYRWEEYGLLPHLRKKTKGEVILEVPVLKHEGLAREHMHRSPKQMLEHAGEDLFCASPITDRRLDTFYKRYFESTVSLSDYKGDFIVPEIWLSQITPIEQVKIIKRIST